MSEVEKKENIMEQWFSMQKKVFQMWQEGLTPTAVSSKPVESMKSSVDIYNKWFESMSDIYKNNYNRIFQPNSYYDAYNNMFAGANVYTNLKRFYDDILEKVLDTVKLDKKTTLQTNAEEYMRLLSDNFVPYLPQPIQRLFNESLQMQKQLLAGSEGMYQSMFAGVKDLQGVVYRGILGDKEAGLEYLSILNENYKKAVGQLMNIPSFGANDDLVNMQIKGINNFVNYYNSLSQFNEKILKVGYDSMEAVVEKYKETLKSGLQPKSFEEFYSFWWKLNEEAYKDLFNSDEFNKIVDQVNNSRKEFESNYEEMVQKQLEKQPFATKRDVEALKDAIEALREELKKAK